MDYLTYLGSVPQVVAVQLRRKGVKAELSTFGDVTCVSLRSRGVDLMVVGSTRINQVQFYGDGDPDFRPYRGALPWGLSMSFNQAAVEALLGRQGRSYAAQDVPGVGSLAAGEAYYLDDLEVSCRYAENNSGIAYLTVAGSGLKPYRR